MAKKRRGAAGGLRGNLLDTQSGFTKPGPQFVGLMFTSGINLAGAGPPDQIREARVLNF